MLQEASHTYKILTEESGRLEGEACWIVDPLAGTTTYAHALPIFASSIALERQGVVHDPIAEEIYMAKRRVNATLNAQAIKTSATDELIGALLATTFLTTARICNLPSASLVTLHSQSMRRLGSATLDLCYVAAGQLDGYYERGV
ncbi:MAG: hypothetical protein JOZ19_05200 [Rubrobacter sp.]|nr:hypothetical protein [Rubrobacter sp.]